MSTAAPPRCTLLLLAYQQASTVYAAAQACLAQQCELIEIIFSDDASPDGTFAELQRAAASYHGPHQLRVRRNEVNQGIGEHYNTLVREARGQLLVTCAGDDLSTPDRVARLLAAWRAGGERADLIASHLIDLDDADQEHGVIRVDDLGQWRTVADWARQRPYIVGAGHAFTRRMMEHYGPLHRGLAYEDQAMVLRAIALGGAITVDAPLVKYRRGGVSGRAALPSPQAMLDWERRRRKREKVEHLQLCADARTAGCEAQVLGALKRDMGRRAFLDQIHDAPTLGDRWAALQAGADLPWGWRLRKTLRAMFPQAAWRVRVWADALRQHRTA